MRSMKVHFSYQTNKCHFRAINFYKSDGCSFFNENCMILEHYSMNKDLSLKLLILIHICVSAESTPCPNRFIVEQREKKLNM